MSDEQTPDKPDSVWKKEISFRRRGDGEEASEAKDGESTSIWKKELSLRNKSGAGEPEGTAEETAAQPALPAASDPEFEALLAEFAVAPTDGAAVPAPPADGAAAIEHDWLTKPLEEVSEPPAEPVTEELPALEAEPVPALEAEPPLDAVAPVEQAPVFELPAAGPEPVPVAPPGPLPEPTPELALELDLPVASVELPVPEPESDPAPVDAGPDPAAGKVPFYKRDLSFKRAPKAERPAKAPKADKPRKEQRAAEPAEGETGKVPFYKRDLSFKRGPKHWDAAEPPAAAKPAREAAAEGKPKLRRPPRPRPSLPSMPSFGGSGGAKKVIGLKIGGSQIAAARIANGDQPELVQAVREPLERGIVVGGELRDPEALAAALKDFFARHKLPKRGIRLGIANNRIGVRTFDVTGIDDPKQLGNAVRFRAQEVLPIPIEEAVIDYQVLSEGTTEDGQPLRRVLLVVAYRELVDRYVYACRKAGLQVVGIDLEAFALLRAVAEPYDPVPGSERGALVAVSVGHDRSTFAVSDGRVCEFTRVLEWGGWALNVAISRALDMAPSEVEPLKRALSFTGVEEVPGGFGADQLETAREAARKQLQSFARELVSSLQFYQNQPGSLGIGEIVLTGGTTHLPGLGDELQRLIGVPVRVADPLSRLKVSKKVQERQQVGSLAVAIGLGIDD